MRPSGSLLTALSHRRIPPLNSILTYAFVLFTPGVDSKDPTRDETGQM